MTRTFNGTDTDPPRGYKLADRIIKVLTPAQLEEIDVVMPIPETSNTSAPCCAARLGKSYCQGFVKNRYVFRTFIMNGQSLREKGVRRKLNAMEEQFDGKTVLLVDDSIGKILHRFLTSNDTRRRRLISV